MAELKRCPFCGGEAMISPYLELGNLYMVKCRNCNIGRVGISEREAVKEWNNRPSPWHTGTPTEEGWYLLHYPKSKEQPYELAQWNGEHFVAVKPFHAIIVRIEASSVPYWQKIKED